MKVRQDMRASDRERQQAVDRLRAGLEDGRLTMEEYTDRVLVNVVIWALVCVTTGSLIYPWPLWVAGPYGAILLAVTACVSPAPLAGALSARAR